MFQKLKQTIRKRPLICFYILSVLIEIATIPIFLSIGGDRPVIEAFEKSGIPFKTDLVTAFQVVLAVPESFPGILLSIVQVAAVDIAVLIIVKLAYGQKGVTDLMSRFRFWSKKTHKSRAVKTWAACLFIFSAMNLATAGLNKLVFSNELVWHINFFSIHFAISFLIAMFLDGGGLFEENGWRGFALPILQSHFNPLKASIVLGFMWFGWHVPVKFDTFSYGIGNAIAIFSILAVKFVLLSIIMTFFFNRVGGTTIIAIVMHGLSNDSVGLGGQTLVEGAAAYLTTEINLVIPMLVVATWLTLKTRGGLGLKTNYSELASTAK